MDLGIKGKKALVCAASKGLGRACATHLAREGAIVTITGRDMQALEAAASEIKSETGAVVKIAAGDISTVLGRAEALKACPQPDILVNNNGGPPPGSFRNLTRDDWIKAIDANMIAPIEMIRATVDGMIERKFGRIVNNTSSSVKSPTKTLDLSNGARAGLTGFIAGISRETVRHNVTINNLLPGWFGTERLYTAILGRQLKPGQTIEEKIAEVAGNQLSGRIGIPDEFGAACAFLCSQYAGYITGQNLLMDGGEFRSLL
mgnify:CR=1 FL=1